MRHLRPRHVTAVLLTAVLGLASCSSGSSGDVAANASTSDPVPTVTSDLDGATEATDTTTSTGVVGGTTTLAERSTGTAADGQGDPPATTAATAPATSAPAPAAAPEVVELPPTVAPLTTVPATDPVVTVAVPPTGPPGPLASGFMPDLLGQFLDDVPWLTEDPTLTVTVNELATNAPPGMILETDPLPGAAASQTIGVTIAVAE